MQETSVKQVEHGVFCTTHIDIDWQPLFEKVLVSQFLCVVDRYGGVAPA